MDGHLNTANDGKENGQVSRAPAPQWLWYLGVLVKWRTFILTTTIGAAAVATVVSLFLPVWYQSSSVILLSSASDLFGISKLLGGGGAFEGILGKGKTEDFDRYEAIFTSERLRLAVIEKFNLIHEYELDKEGIREPIKNALLTLNENISLKENKNGSITVSAWYKDDSVKAAEMTNFVVTMMDSINRQLATESARNQRIFIERRYLQALEDLKSSEVRLNLFQKEYKVAEVKDQVRASLEASAQLEASAMQSEVEYQVLRKTLGEDNPQVAAAKSRTDELRRQAKKFELGGLPSDIIIPFNKMPDLAMEYLRLYRGVLIQTKIVEFLVPQYEQAKIQEAKDTPTILVLDKARVPEWKAKPKRLTIIGISTLIAFFAAGLIAFASEQKRIAEQTESSSYNQVISLLRQPLKNQPKE